MIYYPKCKSGYHAFGCCICIKDESPPPEEEPVKPAEAPADSGLKKEDAAPVIGVNETPKIVDNSVKAYGRGVGYPWMFGDKFGSLD